MKRIVTLLLLSLLPTFVGAQEGLDDQEVVGYDGTYSYLRTLEGSATLIPPDQGDREQAEVNQPLLVGDRLWVAPRGRAEVLLSDGNLLRLDGDSEATFEHLAYSPEAKDTITEIELRYGNAQLVVTEESLGEELPRLRTPNAEILINDFGSYRITSDGGDWTAVVVRSGEVQLITARGNLTVQAGEQGLVEGASLPRASLELADRRDSLERWGDRLAEEVPDSSYVDDSLRYAAAPLDDHGDWLEVEGRRAWRPRVAVDWRPYWQGHWRSTSLGLTWVSGEPWGWVPYHYGSWSRHRHHGWVWYPGYRFAPAWVYWYFGPSHTAWVPVGHYTHHYRRHRGFRFGLYGWAGGHYDYYRYWTFCPSRYFGSRHYRRHYVHGRDWHRRYGKRDVPRGILTTDTRRITPERWNEPREVMRVLRTRPSGDLRADLPDVTPFVARRDALPDDVKRRVLVKDGGERRLAGTPLAPSLADVRPDRPRAASVGVTTSPRTAERRKPRYTTDGGPKADTAPRNVTGVTRGGGVVDGAPRAAKPRAGNPQGVTPRSAPRADLPRAGKPRVESDRAPRAAKPRSVTPRSAPRADVPRSKPSPRSAAPRADRPRSKPAPRTSTPRSSAPRTKPRAPERRSQSVTPRATPRPRVQPDAKPRAATPRSAPRTSAPRSTPAKPRTRAPRSTPAKPRTSAPRSAPKPRTSAPAPRNRAPRTQAPRSKAPRTQTPRTQAPRSSKPRASAPRSAPSAKPRTSPRRSAPRASSPSRSSGNRSGSKARSSSGSSGKKSSSSSKSRPRKPRN
ncbi:MAG: DUF6600 domain-containing protein [Acidobacteriota bacterium]